MNFILSKCTSFLKWSGKSICCMALIYQLSACTTPPKSNNPVMNALYEFPDFKPNAATKAIVIIADNSCMTCNKELAELMAQYTTRKDILFVVAAHESAIDLSPFTATSRKDMVFDYNHTLTGNQIIQGSTVLFLNNKQVDTAIQIEAAALAQQLAFLKQRL